MGARVNVFIVEDEIEGTGVYLYSHWDGVRILDKIKEGLVRGKDRWEDPQYLARIIFCSIVKDDLLGTTNYGISSTLHDNQYPIVVIKNNQTIGISTEGHAPITYYETSFDEFIENGTSFKKFKDRMKE